MAKRETRTPKPAPCGTCVHQDSESGEYYGGGFDYCSLNIWTPKYGECKKYKKGASWAETVAAMSANMRGPIAEESKDYYDALLAQSTIVKNLYKVAAE